MGREAEWDTRRRVGDLQTRGRVRFGERESEREAE